MTTARTIARAVRALPDRQIADLVCRAEDATVARVAKLLIPGKGPTAILRVLLHPAPPPGNDVVPPAAPAPPRDPNHVAPPARPAGGTRGQKRVRGDSIAPLIARVDALLDQPRAFSMRDLAAKVGGGIWQIQHALSVLKARGRAALHGTRASARWGRTIDLARNDPPTSPLVLVAALLREEGRPLKRTEIADRLDIPAEKLVAVLRKLRNRGQAVTVGEGLATRWCATETPPSATARRTPCPHPYQPRACEVPPPAAPETPPPLPRAKKPRAAPAPSVPAPVVAAIPVDVPGPVVAPETPGEDGEDAEDREVEAEILRQCAAAPVTAELLAARLAPMSHRQIAGDAEADLVRRYQAGDRNAGEMLLLAHDKVIRFWAKKHNVGIHDLERGDLYTASQVGFLKGVERFDQRQGVKLITYAGHWAKHRIQRVIANEGTTIRVPVHMRDRPENKRHAHEAFFAVRPARLDAPLSTHYEEGREQTLFDVLAAADVPAEEQAITTQDRARIRAVVDRLSKGLNPREQAILEHRWMSDEQKSLREVGDMFGISRERIRQIEETLAVKVRKAFERAGLRDLYAPLTPKPAPATLPKSPPIAAATL